MVYFRSLRLNVTEESLGERGPDGRRWRHSVAAYTHEEALLVLDDDQPPVRDPQDPP